MKNFESKLFSSKKIESQEEIPTLHIDNQYVEYIPENFKNNPEEYIEEQGENIKSGQILYHTDGSIREDPTAAKFLPEWQNEREEKIQTVSKKVNLEKVRTRTEANGKKFTEPLLEYKMMTLCQTLDLPSAKPIGFVKQNKNLYTLMEKVKGYTWTENDKKVLAKQGFKVSDEKLVQKQIENLINELKERYEKFGIYRKWKHSDMIFNLDIENKKVLDIIPVDWEKSYLDIERLNKTISNYPQDIQQKIQKTILLKA